MVHPDYLGFRAQRCVQHPRWPTRLEMDEALERWTWLGLDHCVSCGRPLGVRRYYLQHMAYPFLDGSDHRWETVDVEYLNPVFTFRILTHEASIDLECAFKAFPSATWMPQAIADLAKKDSVMEESYLCELDFHRSRQRP
jgi:hypothetical protein